MEIATSNPMRNGRPPAWVTADKFLGRNIKNVISASVFQKTLWHLFFAPVAFKKRQHLRTTCCLWLLYTLRHKEKPVTGVANGKWKKVI
jgi:hypothetical protein